MELDREQISAVRYGFESVFNAMQALEALLTSLGDKDREKQLERLRWLYDQQLLGFNQQAAGQQVDALNLEDVRKKLDEQALKGTDDRVFGTRYVYCSQHLRVHPTGWCTVSNMDKIALLSDTEEGANTEWRQKKLAMGLS